jgi:hypothetical protein
VRPRINPLCFLVLVGCLIGGCDEDKRASDIPEKKSNFQKIVFTEPQSGSTVTLISENECEIENQSGQVLRATYSRQDGKLRVVAETRDGLLAKYFDILTEGLRASDSDKVYLLPEPLGRVREKMRAAKDAEARTATAKRDAQGGVTRRIKTFSVRTDAGNTDLTVTDGSLETYAVTRMEVSDVREPNQRVYFSDLKSLRAWDDETVIVNNRDRYQCKSQSERDEIIGEIKAAYAAWAFRFPDPTREKPF